LQNLQVRN
ncbi:Xanthine phosphoribosyltransferase, partial [Haemophilus influenzae]